MASSSTLYDVTITFLRAAHVPIGDLNDFSCDPYIVASINLADPHLDSPPPIYFRTPTKRRTLEPVWDAEWCIGGVPRTGFYLEMQINDEDPGNHDDHIGAATADFARNLTEGVEEKDMEIKIKKRKGDMRAHAATYVGSMLFKKISRHGRVWVSIKVTGKSADQSVKKLYTTGPHAWTEHFSPILGKLTHTKSGTDAETEKKAFSFKANQLQLNGPVPSELKFEYVGYRPFITYLFTMKGIEGWILNRALHKQHDMVYSYDQNTQYGVVSREELSRKFLDMTSWGEGGRMFTYVMMLDGQWRFTETGEEFAIQFLSKHSMHSNVTKEIAISGEFFIRSLKGNSANAGKTPEENWQPNDAELDPKDFELVIDNDSGTYRPKKEVLPVLQAFLSKEGNLSGLGKITVKDGFDEELKSWKDAHVKDKQKKQKDGGAPAKVAQVRRGSSVSDGAARHLGEAKTISSGEVEAKLDEGEERGGGRPEVHGEGQKEGAQRGRSENGGA